MYTDLDLDDVRSDDALEDELGDAVSLCDLVVLIAQVEQEDVDLATVVGIDHACARVDHELAREP